ncbi:MAG: hypothetical protein AB2A00_22185 [Myxococcota bacterium]
MTTRDPGEATDPQLQDAANLLRSLPVEKPEGSLSESIMAQVRPAAERRRRVWRTLIALALCAALFYVGTLAWALLGESP